MAIQIADLTELDPQDVADTAEVLSALLVSRYPDLDPSRGALSRLLLHPAAVLSLKSRTELDRLQRAMSLLTAAQDPDLDDADLLDAAASNFRISRYAGSAATGSIIIVVSRLDPLLIPRGFTVVARGLSYSTDRPYSVRVDTAGVTGETDRVLTPAANDTWVFSIPVTAADVGSTGRLLRGEAVTPVTLPANFVKAYAASDFSGGVDQETNESLITRVRTGIACRALSDRTSMGASLLAEWPGVVTHSVIGAGDPEMSRDQHGIFPGSVGGCVDWFIRTGQLPIRKLLNVVATLVEIESADSSVWQFSIGRDAAPGFYDVYSVAQVNSDASGGYEIVDDVRSFDVSTLDSGIPIPDIQSAAEAAYSRFQTAVVRFRDTDTATTGLTVGDTRAYDVVVRQFSDLADIQDTFGARDRSGVAGDVLVRAPVPAYLTLSLDVRQPVDSLAISVDALQNDVMSVVNGLPIGSELPSSIVLDTVHRHLPAGAFVRSLDMLCRIRMPAGASIWFRDSELIEIPNRPEDQVTPRTTVFILEPDSVSVSIQTTNRLNI